MKHGKRAHAERKKVHANRGERRKAFNASTLLRFHALTQITRLTGQWLLAGANWNNGTNAGSRARNANNYRWNTNSNYGCRFAADTGLRAKLLAGSV